MQYINYLIQLVIYFNVLLSLMILTRYLISKLARVSQYSSIKQYQIKNWYITIFSVYFYILFPLIGLYCLRLYNLNRELDLKILYHNISYVFSTLWDLSHIFTTLGLILSILIIINIILSIVLIYKILNNQIYNLYLIIRYNSHDRNYFYNFIYDNINDYRDTDLISFWLLKLSNYLNRRLGYYKMNLVWDKKPDILSSEYTRKWNIYYYEYSKNRPCYHFDVIIYKIMSNKYYDKIIIPFSPLILIIYDCIFNNFIITHVYYYLLIYIPVMLIRRFTILVSTENDTIGKLIWDILYQREHTIYALPENHRKLLDVYIANGIKTVDIPTVGEMDLHVSMYMLECSKFSYIETENYYRNYEGLEIYEPLFIKDDQIKVIRWENGSEIIDYWYIIAIKQYFIKENKYERITYID